jgi:hypothetical protein
MKNAFLRHKGPLNGYVYLSMWTRPSIMYRENYKMGKIVKNSRKVVQLTKTM